jgi:hypothetical protein
MCHFVFIGVSAAQAALARDAFRSAGFHGSAVGNPRVLAAFPQDDEVTVVTRGGCSCGFTTPPTQGFDEAAARLKYRKKGWSPSKIERAIAGRHPREQPALIEFRNAFAALVTSVGGARILAHSFSGLVETEPLPTLLERTISLAEYLAAGGAIDDDVVLEVRAS